MGNSLKILAKKVSALTLQRGKKTEIRQKTGFSASQLDNYLNGKTSPSLDAVDRLAEAVQMDAWELICPRPLSKNQVDSLTEDQRDAIGMIAGMNDAELRPVLLILRAWPGYIKRRDQKKKA